MNTPKVATIVGRYALYGEIAHGGMATIHVGRLMGPAGFSRTVAIKRLHPNFAKDPEFVSMFMDEARLAARIHHPNVVSIIDVVAIQGELLLVMDYVPGDSLSRLLAADRHEKRRPEPAVVIKIVLDVLFGLHAAHEARNERGHILGIVHRDISPQNILVGADGVAHVIDFGVAKAAGRVQTTQEGQIKGKLAYMAPEQILAREVDCRTDLYSISAVMWEALTGRRLFDGRDVELMYKVLEDEVKPPSAFAPGIDPRLDHVVMTGLQRDPNRRYASAVQMAEVLEKALAPASTMQVARWVERVGKTTLQQRADLVSEVECSSEVSSVGYTAPSTDIPTFRSLPGEGSSAHLIAMNVDGTPSADGATQTSSTISKMSAQPPKSKTVWWLAAAVGIVCLVGGGLVLVRIASRDLGRHPAPAAASSDLMPTASAAGPIADSAADDPTHDSQSPAATTEPPVAASSGQDAAGPTASAVPTQPRDTTKPPVKTPPLVPYPDDKTKAQNKYGF